jgi:hypothetical protein
MRRVVLFALAWVAAFAIFAAALQWSSRQTPRATAAANAGTALTRALNNVDRGSNRGRMPAWTVVGATSAHHVMVVEVEAQRAEQARAIAVQIVEPLRDRYEEVLVYVRRPGTSKELAARRIQWTPRGGYVESVYAER